MRRSWVVPLAPFLFSLALSACTVGTTVFWQDSGFYLTAVHEFSLLYSHGFIFYLVLCKVWTWIAAPLFGFTGAVHLFSALCAAGAASFVSRAARAFLWRMNLLPGSDLAAIGAGCIVAAGYSVWSSALLAKPYALFFLMTAMLLWAAVVAERRRDFLLVGALLGAAWAAHPSGALLIPGVLVFALARRDRIREFGWTVVAWTAVLSMVAAILPSLIVPLIASRESIYDFASPSTPGDFVRFLLGSGYTGGSTFGVDPRRWAHASSFVWEEYLAVGLVLVAIGIFQVARVRRHLLVPIAAAALPTIAVSLTFRIEVYMDMWLVPAYLILSLFTAVGLQKLAVKRTAIAAGALGAGLCWMIAANSADLNQRHYDTADRFGRHLVKNLDPGSYLFLTYDDSISTVTSLRTVHGVRQDLGLVINLRLGLPWYDARLPRFVPCRIPDWEKSYRSMPGVRMASFELNAFANENVAPGRPLFCEIDPDVRFLRPDLAVVPAGMLWKISVREEATLDPRYWDYPTDLLELARNVRRYRGMMVRDVDGKVLSKPEPYEHRLLIRLCQARLRLADLMLERTPQASLDQYELIRRAFPPYEEDLKFQLQWGTALALTKHPAEAEVALQTVVDKDASRKAKALANYYLGEIAAAGGRKADAQMRWKLALELGGLDEVKRRRAEEGARQP